MRSLAYAINISLDGCCDHTKFGGSDFDGGELLGYYVGLLEDSGLLLYGRTTYELMVPYWPDVAKDPSSDKSDRQFSQAFCAVDKFVFSRTLERAAEKGTRIARSGLREEVLRLKGEPGRRILAGGVSLPAQLLELGLIDEFHFVVHPKVVGEGRRLFDGVRLGGNLELVSSRSFKSGVVALHYLKRG